MPREMLVNVADGDECRIAIVEDGRLEELYVERASLSSHVGNIYKARVTNIEPGIQAAFVDFGLSKNGFLHISDLHPRYFMCRGEEHTEPVGKRKALKDRPPIQQCLKKGQDLIVQVTKEGIGTKGPTLTTYVSIPGKYIVMMPWMHKLGVSQKIEDDAERARLREVIESVKLPEKAGFIVRTAAAGSSKRDLQNDLAYISRLWKAIQKRIDVDHAPCELYRESDLVIRTMRDIFNSGIIKIICDCDATAKKIRDFLSIAQPRFKHRVTFYDGKVPLFHKYKVEEEIARIHSRRVELKNGGSIIIEQTEALVAIDVNSGRYRKNESAEQTALKINTEAAKEIARQLRLRDLGGLIICDFIDMRSQENRREVEKVFRNAMKDDRARCRMLKISAFGIIEMTRQRMRPSLTSSAYQDCPLCLGSGYVRSPESLAIEMMRLLSMACSQDGVRKIELILSPQAAGYLQNERRAALSQMEQESNKKINIVGDSQYQGEHCQIFCYDEQGAAVKFPQ